MTDYNDPPPYEEAPLLRPPRQPGQFDRFWDCLRRVTNNPTCFIAVFCAGCIILSVSVTLIVVLGRSTNIVTTTSTSTTTTTITTTTTKAVKTTTITQGVCFDGNSMISKSDGSWTRIRQLNVGDQVLVAHFHVNGSIELRPSPILAIDVYQHYNPHSPVYYREILTPIHNSALHITHSHSLRVRKKQNSYSEYLFASEIDVGDHLYFVDEYGRSIIEVPVTKINETILFDAYAPLTVEGNIIVNHLIVSCYGTFTHSVGHLVKMARRWYLYYHLNLIFISI